MHRKSKIPYNEWFFSTLAWIFIMYFYYITVFWGSLDFMARGAAKNYLQSWLPHLELIIQGVLFGLLFGVINTITDRSSVGKKAFWIIILIKSILYILAIFIIGLITNSVFTFFTLIDGGTYNDLLQFFAPKYIISIAIYFTFFIILMNFLFQINKKFGYGNLIKLIIGKYQTPKEEQKIFLFLDLNGSTTIAEKLGHRVYSTLLRSCYHDLTEIILKFKAEVYQYVGDEVVLCWDIKRGFKDLNCIKTFYAFEKKLIARDRYYNNNFKVTPTFKGGMDVGFVTATEIGDIKREIAYHGDVLNTASRILEQCKILHHKLLVSENVEKNLSRLNGFSKEFVGEISLRGKQNKINVFRIDYSGG